TVSHQAAYAAHPHVHADTNLRVVIAAGAGRRRSGYIQGFGGIDLAAGRTFATQLAEIEVAVPVQAKANYSKTNDENKKPATFFNFYGHGFLQMIVSRASSFLNHRGHRGTRR